MTAFSALLASTVILALAGGLTSPAHADDYPTWAQVQAAKQSAAAAQQELAVIQADVVQLESQEQAAADSELKAAYAATVATEHLQLAQSALASLDRQLATARTQSMEATARFAGIEVALQRVGGGDTLTAELLAGGQGSADLLSKLSTLSQLARRGAGLETAALQKRNIVMLLEAQSSKAEKLRASLKVVADATAQEAQTAHAAAQASLAAGEQQRTVLTEQAVALNGTAQTLSDAYTAGQLAALQRGGNVTTIDTSGVVVNPAAAQAYARGAIGAYGWGSDQFVCLIELWNRESGWRANAYNPSSGSYGIPQSLPAKKMLTAGADWLTNADTQINWGLSYISRAYHTPCGAWSHETAIGWY
ncbi:MAG: hypothetical protein HIU88_13450 [Acidobacteria bacterium]|nr:hypothetical protein [Acidobacteriota bacterium]